MKRDTKQNIFFLLVKNAIECTPILFFIALILNIVRGCSIGIQTLFMQSFFEAAEKLTLNQQSIIGVLQTLVALGIAYIVNQLINGFGAFLPNIIGYKLSWGLQSKINKKLQKIPSIEFENNSIFELINQTEEGIKAAQVFIQSTAFAITMYLAYFLYMTWYLFTLNPILVFSILIISIPSIFTQWIKSTLYSDLEDDSAKYRRHLNYYSACVGSKETCKETRTLGANSFFIDLFVSTLKMFNKKYWQTHRKAGFYEALTKLVSVIGYGVIIFLLYRSVVSGFITVGAFAAVFSSIDGMFNRMNQLVMTHMGTMAVNYRKMDSIFQLLSMQEDIPRCGKVIKDKMIHIKEVSFCYPNASSNALNNINALINPNETIAIVGENGSGKTTLVKLLMGIFTPVSGEILYNEININDGETSKPQLPISAVFQKFQKYEMSLLENIAISNSIIKPKITEVEQCLERVDISSNLCIFTDGLNTMLSKEFGSIDLSGGLWQRIAIARGIYRDHSVIVLDEPTAAIDPIEETKLFNKFAEICKHSTAIIVTHRLGSVKLADRIFVMRKGEIIAQGTHNELLRKCTYYEDMWNAQAQWYV